MGYSKSPAAPYATRAAPSLWANGVSPECDRAKAFVKRRANEELDGGDPHRASELPFQRSVWDGSVQADHRRSSSSRKWHYLHIFIDKNDNPRDRWSKRRNRGSDAADRRAVPVSPRNTSLLCGARPAGPARH